MIFKARIAYAASVVALALAVVIVASPPTAHALDPGAVTMEGFVTRHDNSPVAHVLVTANCVDLPSATTDIHGYYMITTTVSACTDLNLPVYTRLHDSPSLSHYNASTLTDGVTYINKIRSHAYRVDIRMYSRTIPVPEYGLLGVIGAGSAGIAIVAYVRFRKSNHVRGAS